MRLGVALALLALLAVPGAAARVEAASPAKVVRSKDGRLTLRIPAGALAKPAKIRIRTVPRSALTAQERELAAPGPTYELLPAGLKFRKPVVVEWRGAFDARKGAPAYLLGIRERAGAWEPLRRPRVVANGSRVIASGTTTHFSQVASFDTRLRATLTPPTVVREVGETFDWRVDFETDRPLDFTVLDWFRGAEFGGAVKFAKHLPVPRSASDSESHSELWRCVEVGKGVYGAKADIRDRTLENWFVAIFTKGELQDYSMTFKGTATCTAPGQRPPLSFTLAYAHGAGASCIRANITAASGALLTLEITGPNGFAGRGTLQLKKKATKTAQGTFDFTNLTSRGRYTVRITATVGGESTTEERVVDVTDAPGTAGCKG